MMKYQRQNRAMVLLADGTIFYGKSAGMEGTVTGEICFNTGMTGYQEIFTDPSYYGQILVTTNAHIGNYGINFNEIESDGIKISGLVVKNFSLKHSRAKATGNLRDWLVAHKLMVISDIDTRALVTYIRDHGAMNAIITTEIGDLDALKTQLSQVPPMEGLELASKVSTKEPYSVGDENARIKIAALDIGIKKNILRHFVKRDAYVKVFPYNASFEEISCWKPDGYFISNGPGDPRLLTDAQKLVKEINRRNLPLFGICLGHQIIALANGISTYKMHNGHRGINHPVKNLLTGKGEITSQNHGFAINKEQTELHPEVEITHLHLNDQTVAGIHLKNKNCFSVQYHPEASPGPHDSEYLFDQFIRNIESSLY